MSEIIILVHLKPIIFFFACMMIFPESKGQSRKAIDRSTDVAMFINPLAGFVGSLAIRDYKGTKQLVLSGITNIAVTYALKYTIKKERPDHSDHHAFPSNHTSVSFQGASFIQRRYGWKCGLPAYLLSAYVTWGRTYAKQHDWWDVTAGAIIGTASSYLFTRPFARKHNLTFSPTVFNNQHLGIYASITL